MNIPFESIFQFFSEFCFCVFLFVVVVVVVVVLCVGEGVNKNKQHIDIHATCPSDGI